MAEELAECESLKITEGDDYGGRSTFDRPAVQRIPCLAKHIEIVRWRNVSMVLALVRSYHRGHYYWRPERLRSEAYVLCSTVVAPSREDAAPGTAFNISTYRCPTDVSWIYRPDQVYEVKQHQTLITIMMMMLFSG